MNGNLLDYVSAMGLAKRMMKEGIIDFDDYLRIEERMADRYGIEKSSVYRPNELIKGELRAIYMIPRKEG